MFEEDLEEETTLPFNSDEFDPSMSNSMANSTSEPMTSEQIDIENTKSLLSEFLEDKDDIFKAKVLNIVVKHGLPSNDPLFLLLFATSSLQVMLEEAPSALHLSIEKARQTQDKIALEATQNTKTEIAKATRELITKTEALQLSRPTKVLIPGLSLFAIVFGLGLLSGVGLTVSLNQLASSGRVLSVSQAATLDWANSEQGQYAKNLWEWNKNYLQSGNCLKDMQQLGVKLTFGTKTTVSGICALWVVPPSQRQYQQQ